ncbi:MAG: DUF4910 domain-containing protein [Holophagales bacterium]|nr:DUF4910 domain-containing protein [Holophagales bacterium]
MAFPGDEAAIGREIYGFAEKAYPICRSITGDGVRETLGLVAEIAPGLEVHEVATGTEVLDWTVPKEWNVRGARLLGPSGEVIVDFADHNLHLMGYSVPARREIGLDELQAHLMSAPQRPHAIPYRTSYWNENWAFCLCHSVREALEEGTYRVEIDTTLEDGHLTYGEVCLDATVPGPAGELEGEGVVLVSAHCCHPSLANDNLSGLGVVAHLARMVAAKAERRYSYRFLFVPGTIGAIVWLARNRELASKVRHGLVAANLGDAGPFHFKRSQRGDTELDLAVEHVLEASGERYQVEDFSPFGYDERQYCSPGFDLAVGLLSRSPWGRFPEYHTSDDDLDLIRPGRLGRSLRRYWEVLEVLEANRVYRNLRPEGEPQLGRRGLYHHIGGGEEGRDRQLALLWVLNQADGRRSLLDIADRAGMPFPRILEAARALEEAELLAEVRPSARR